MTLDDQQRRISSFALATPGVFFLLRVVHLTTKVKFPVTGPNEMLFADSVFAGMICYTCSHLKFMQCSGRMVAIALLRLFFLFFLFFSIYLQPQWYHVHKSALDYAICWILLSVHIICTTCCLTMCFTIMVQEHVVDFFSWQDLKDYFNPPQDQGHPPRYQDAISNSAHPPTYEEALASRPPGYTPTNTPPATHQDQSSVLISRCNNQDRYQADVEEAETMF